MGHLIFYLIINFSICAATVFTVTNTIKTTRSLDHKPVDFSKLKRFRWCRCWESAYSIDPHLHLPGGSILSWGEYGDKALEEKEIYSDDEYIITAKNKKTGKDEYITLWKIKSTIGIYEKEKDARHVAEIWWRVAYK